ncbi:HET-domain-containing protein [Lentinus tigrinus ALCF2SS1-6]|uniref:HET-domain-containing protein n=1 Tax=Lentinus tigrinus ALCF2SS1-6 TaxID=1328759 RepID=A0A5C2S7H6_9APHY|nr:HET-domain-containing protein [Lentinus tigrinus ALCF2SS1-6]
MRLLNTRTGEFVWVENPHQVRYAALSHVWCKDPRRETSYHDIVRFQDEARSARSRGEILPEDAVLSRASYKIRGACALARADGIDWLWVDTCCIDKASSAELEGAINAMYAWYHGSTVCYVFLQDVDAHEDPYAPDSGFRKSEWHVRGWTLQELIAPRVVLFFSRSWRFIGAKHGMAGLIADVTGVDREVITGHLPVNALSVARRMSWASRRVTTKREDEAYCLMGIFGVHIPVVYGEGSMAFLRLQEEILKRIPDESIFIWDRALYPRTALLDTGHGAFPQDAHPAPFAPSPAFFSTSADIISVPKNRLCEIIGIPIPPTTYTSTSHGVRTTLPLLRLADGLFVAVLACQRNDTLLGLAIKKTPTSNVYSICVLDANHELVHADDLSCIVQFPIPLDGTALPSTASDTAVVKEVSILNPLYVPPTRQVLPSHYVPLRHHVMGLSERSVRCLASLGYRSSLHAPSVSLTTITLSSFDSRPVASVDLRRCGCSDILSSESTQPCSFAVRVTRYQYKPPVGGYLDDDGGTLERCSLGNGWHHLEVAVSSAPSPASDEAPSSSRTSSSLATSNPPPRRFMLSRSELRPDERRPRELTLALACDYPGDDQYPARFTLSIDPPLRGEGASTYTDESTSTLTCEDEWVPPRPRGRDADLPQLLKGEDGKDDHGDHGSHTDADRNKVRARITRLGGLLGLRVLSRAPARLWAAVKRGVTACQKEGWSSPATSVYGSEVKRGCGASGESLPRIVVYEASTVSTRPSSSTLPREKTR